jgi:hypothetical protein
MDNLGRPDTESNGLKSPNREASDICYEKLFLYPGSSEIRLVILFPRFKGGGIKYDLVKSDMETAGYEALSYAWGSTKLTETIYVNEQQFLVTQNLKTALCYLQQDKPRSLWIDALCINQASIVERSQQVPKMCQIFGRARQVLAWLGSEEPGSAVTMDLISHMANEWVRAGQFNEQVYIPEQMRSEDILDAAEDLFQRPWWLRVWVIQEVALSKIDPLVGCGHKWLPWSALRYATKTAYGRVHRWPVHAFLHLDNIRSYFHKGSGVPMVDLLRISARYEATDGRDSIYGLLAIALEHERQAISPDYSKNLDSILLEVTRNHIMATRKLDIVELAAWEQWFRPFGLPTWSQILPPNHMHLGVMPIHRLGSIYSASANLEAEVSFLNIKQLVAKGIYFDVIDKVLKPIPIYFAYEAEAFDEIEVTSDAALSKHIKESDPRQLLDRSQPLWKTLVCGRLYEEGWESNLNAGFYSSIAAPKKMGELYEMARGRKRSSAFIGPEHDHANCHDQRHCECRFKFTKPFSVSMHAATKGRTFFTTESGFIRLGPCGTRVGDVVTVLFGGGAPFVLRPVDAGFEVAGNCYIDSIMEGELVRLYQRGLLEARDFTLC